MNLFTRKLRALSVFTATAVIVMSLLMVSCMTERIGTKGEAIFLIAELPKTEEYKISGKSVDIGIVYKFDGVVNYNKRWCFFNGKQYWNTDKAKLDEIAEKVGLTLPSNMDLPSKKAGITVENSWLRILVTMVCSPEMVEGLGLLIFALLVVVIAYTYKFIYKRRPKIQVLPPVSDNLNEQNAAKLVFRYHYKIKKYNDTVVNWSTFKSAFNAGTYSVLLPPGKCSIVFSSTYEYEHKKMVEAVDHLADGKLEAGKTYCMKTYLNEINSEKIQWTHIMEINGSALEEYVKGNALGDCVSKTTLFVASRYITRIAENITPDTTQQFVSNVMRQMQGNGYRFVDERRDNAITLFEEFEKFPVKMLPGEVYTYKRDNWILLISRGELGIMMSFSNSK